MYAVCESNMCSYIHLCIKISHICIWICEPKRQKGSMYEKRQLRENWWKIWSRTANEYGQQDDEMFLIGIRFITALFHLGMSATALLKRFWVLDEKLKSQKFAISLIMGLFKLENHLKYIFILMNCDNNGNEIFSPNKRDQKALTTFFCL